MSVYDELHVPIAQGTSLKDSHFKTLNHSGFVRAPTIMAQWFLLVGETWQHSKIPENEVMKAYLVSMLSKYTSRVNIHNIVVGFSSLMTQLDCGSLEPQLAEDLADVNILHISLFPGRLAYRHYPSSLKKSVDFGIKLYDYLHTNAKKEDWNREAYREMSNNFFRAVIILKSLSPQLLAQEEKLRRLSGKALRLPHRLEREMEQEQMEVFEKMYLRGRDQNTSLQ